VAFLLVREAHPASHVVSLPCPDTQTLLAAPIRVGGVKKPLSSLYAGKYEGLDGRIHKQSQMWEVRYRTVTDV
jgi:hypothetical protein